MTEVTKELLRGNVPIDSEIQSIDISSIKAEFESEKCKKRALVTTESGVLRIDNFECIDKDVFRYFDDLNPIDRINAVDSSLRIGVASFKMNRAMEPVDYIQRRFTAMHESFDSMTQQVRNTLAEEVQQKFGKDGEISEYLEKMLGPNGSFATLLDSSQKDSPLNKLKIDIQGLLLQIGSQIAADKKVDEFRNSTPAKGFDFEEYIDETLGRVIRLSKGDSYESVSTQMGRLGKSRKGDRVISLGGEKGARIVVEPKDVAQISLQEIHRVAEESMKNRDAQYTIIVLKHSSALPAGVGHINEYENHVVLALTSENSEGNLEKHQDLLAMSYHIAKIRVLQQLRKEANLDTSYFRERVSEIRAQIQGFSKLSTHIANIRDQLVQIETISRNAKSEIEVGLGSIEDMIK